MKYKNLLLPTFIGIGEMKCATTWLSECLRYHPEIFMTTPKEIHFFSREPNWSNGVKWYSQYFKGSSTYKERGEFSTSYLHNYICSERIKKIINTPKIIAILRDPTDRFISHYKQLIRNGTLSKLKYRKLNTTTFHETIRIFPSLINRGRFFTNISPYIERFGKENIKIILKDNIEKSPLSEIREVYKFLGIDHSFVPSIFNKQVSPGITPKLLTLESARIRLFFILSERFPPFFNGIRRLRLAEFYRKLNADKSIHSFNVDEKVIEELTIYYHNEIMNMEKLLRQDLGTWKSQNSITKKYYSLYV